MLTFFSFFSFLYCFLYVFLKDLSRKLFVYTFHNDFEFNLDLVCERVEEELCNPKYFFGGVKEPSIIFDFCDATGTDSYETHFRCRLWDLLADEAQLITLGAQDNVPISLCTECYSNDSDDSINAYFTAFMGKNKARRILTIKDLEN